MWQGGAAQHVATQLDNRLREHLKSRNNLFSEASAGLALSRPILCLFDRSFELSVVCLRLLTTSVADIKLLSRAQEA